MENILISLSSLSAILTWKSIHVNHLYTLLFNCLVCLILSTSKFECSKWQRLSRPGSKLILCYGCVIVPAILSFKCDENKISCLDAIGSLFIALFIFVLMFKTEKYLSYGCAVIFCLIFSVYYPQLQSYDILWIGMKLIVFTTLISTCMIGCPYSFSMGECVVVCQLITCLCSESSIRIFESSNFVARVTIIFGLLITLLVLIIALDFSFVKSHHSRVIHFYFLVLVFLVMVFVIMWQQLIIEVKNMFYFLLDNYPVRGILLLCWFFVAVLCCLYTVFRQSQQKASTSERKMYHIFILLVYIPGLLYDIPLLVLLSVFVFGLFVVIEIIYAFKIEPLGKKLHGVLNIFTSKQDTGLLVLTPAYLLLGLSLPVWLCCLQHPALLVHSETLIPIKCFSGVLSVGIGDAFASVVGSRYGKLKIPGTHKTLEGTASSIFSQLLFVYVLSSFSSVQVLITPIITAIIVVALVEAFTHEVDNLVLPILMYFLII